MYLTECSLYLCICVAWSVWLVLKLEQIFPSNSVLFETMTKRLQETGTVAGTLPHKCIFLYVIYDGNSPNNRLTNLPDCHGNADTQSPNGVSRGKFSAGASDSKTAVSLGGGFRQRSPDWHRTLDLASLLMPFVMVPISRGLLIGATCTECIYNSCVSKVSVQEWWHVSRIWRAITNFRRRWPTANTQIQRHLKCRCFRNQTQSEKKYPTR